MEYNARWLFLVCVSLAAASAEQTLNVRDFGAAGDGVKKDTAAIAAAIEACGRAGGGVVEFPPGRYLTGAITLKSNLTLQVDAGAVILGSEDPADYPLRRSPWRDSEELSALIYGDGLVNVSLRGRGTIDGQGQVWWKRHRLASPKKGQPRASGADLAEAAKVQHGRPHLIKLVRSKNVWMEGLTLVNSPSWTVNPVFCEFVTITGLTIVNPPDSPNTDGINPESCRNVHISNCHIDVGDDCVTIKSGTDAIGRQVGKPCENITVTNCTMLHGHGGVVVGSEMSGGARNIAVSNCVFQGTQRGIRVKSQRGRGGVVEGMVVDNIVMQDVQEAFSITMYYQGRETPGETHAVDEGTPQFRDIRIGNVTVRGSRSAGEIAGLAEMPISGLSFSHVRIAAQRGFTCRHARDLVFRDVQIDTDAGPALSAEDVSGLDLAAFRTAKPHADAPVLDLNQVQDAFVHESSTPRGTGTFLRVRGAASRDIVAGSSNDLRHAARAVETGKDAARAAVIEK